VTVYKLKDEIEDAHSRLMFLLDYAIFPCKYLIQKIIDLMIAFVHKLVLIYF